MRKTTILIPAYDPDERLLDLIVDLQAQSNYAILLVDDGSSEAGKAILQQAKALGCILRTHGRNRGKGAALRTGFAYLRTQEEQPDVVVTADCDGQHTATDIIRVAQEVRPGSREMILGSRTFRGEVPGKSRIGNAVSRKLFALLTGLTIWDTQTGLRGFPGTLLDWLLRLDGNRFEYEQNMLFSCSRDGVQVRELPIETVYLQQNTGSHYRPVWDSLRIAGSFLRFSAVSLFCAVTDFFLLDILYRLFSSLLPAVLLTRLCTASLQYLANHYLVFHESRENMKRSSLRYAGLACVMLGLNYLLLRLFTATCGIPLLAAKLLTETLLFLLSFCMQRTVVFYAPARVTAERWAE